MTSIPTKRLHWLAALAVLVGPVWVGGCRTSGSSPVSEAAKVSVSKPDSGAVVLLNGGLHLLRGDKWVQPLSSVGSGSIANVYRGSAGEFFVKTYNKGDSQSFARWLVWDPGRDRIVDSISMMTGLEPYRWFEPGHFLAKQEEFTFTQVIRFTNGKPALALARRGQGSHHFLPDGSYIYLDWPKAGGEESRHFSNVIKGGQMLLKIRDKSGRERALAAGSALIRPRFVAGGQAVCYFKPGAILPAANEKSFQHECVDLNGRIRPMGVYRDAIRGGSRTPPQVWSWENSPWFVMADRSERLADSRKPVQYMVVNALTGQKQKALQPPEGFTVVPQFTHRDHGVDFDPAMIMVNARTRTLRVVSVPDLTVMVEKELPSRVHPFSLRGAYIRSPAAPASGIPVADSSRNGGL